MSAPPLTLELWALAFVPVLVLLVTFIALRWGAPKAGAAAWFVALAGGATFFGGDAQLLAVASAKGLSLSLFVLSIIWSSVYLYNVVEKLDGPRVIGLAMARLVGDKLLQVLLIGWCFSGFLQGITGFGVPVAVATPLLTIVGVRPAPAAVMVLVGHSWAVTFGSMGSSYYTIQLVTRIPGELIGPWMALFFALPIVTCGFAVAHVHGGLAAVRRSAVPVLVTGAVMSFLTWLLNILGAPQIASVFPGLAGCVVLWATARLVAPAEKPTPAVQGGSAAADGRRGLSFNLAFLPYYVLIVLTALSQIPAAKDAMQPYAWGLDYPEMRTALGYVAAAEHLYAKVSILNHPAPLIVGAALVSFLVYIAVGAWRPQVGRAAAKVTVKQCVPTSVGIATTVMMALIMNDTGMTTTLAQGIARATGAVFPLLSPYVGVLGCFMTGSNTTSNVMFGALQMETAKGLGISTVVISAAQSAGGSLGSAIAPAKVLVGAAVVGLSGREGEVMARAIPYCIVLVLLLGIQAWLFAYVLFRGLT